MKNYFDFWGYINKIDGEGWKKSYLKVFRDMGVCESLVWNNVIAICKTEHFEKQGRKNYPKKATTTDYNALTLDMYLNSLTGILFFHDRVYKTYHKYGYIPLYMTCHNPDQTVKVRRSFEYIDLNKIYEMGGFREREILDNLDRVSYDYCNGYKVISFYDGAENRFDYSVKKNNICG